MNNVPYRYTVEINYVTMTKHIQVEQIWIKTSERNRDKSNRKKRDRNE